MDLASVVSASDNELRNLIAMARNVFRQEVLTSKKLMQRFVDDFLNSVMFIDASDALSKNAHNRAYHIIEELLRNRSDLVSKYFADDVFDEQSFDRLLNEFNTTYQSQIRMGSNQAVHRFQSAFNEAQIMTLCRYINLLNVFSHVMYEHEVAAFFEGRPITIPMSCNNRTLARLFSELSRHNFITSRWASVIETNRLVKCPRSDRFIRHSDLSTALCCSLTTEYEANHQNDLANIRQMISILKSEKK
jgi:hypothetical protein